MLTDHNINSEHIASDKKYFLTELDKKLILTLAVKGPMSRYDFHLGGKKERRDGQKKAMLSTGYWTKIKDKLVELCLIKKSSKTKEIEDELKGRPKERYWLTDNGVFIALCLKANISQLEYLHSKYGTFNEDSKVMFEIAKVLPPQKLYLFYLFMVNLYQKGINSTIMFGIKNLGGFRLSKSDLKKVIRIVKLYPSSSAYKSIQLIKSEMNQIKI